MTDTTWAAKVLEGVGRIWAYSYEVNEADNGAEPEDWKTFQTWDVADPYPILGKEYVAVDDALAAIARMGAGDGLIKRATAALEGVTGGPWRVDGEPWNQIVWSGAENRVCFMAHSNGLDDDRDIATARFIAFTRQWVPEAADRIAALTAQNREMALDVLASSGQAQEAYAAQIAAEAERDALRAKVARLEGVLTDMPKAVLRTTVCQGPQWPDDRPGVWLAALEACAKSVQAAVDAALPASDARAEALKEAAAVPEVAELIEAYSDIIDYGPVVFARKDQWARLKAAQEKIAALIPEKQQ